MAETLVVKGKSLSTSGVHSGAASHLGDQIFHAHGAKLWYYAAELCTLSVKYPLQGSALTDTTENTSKMCPLKLTDFCLFCAINHTPPMGFTSFYRVRESNLLLPDDRAGTLTTQPIRLAINS